MAPKLIVGTLKFIVELMNSILGPQSLRVEGV